MPERHKLSALPDVHSFYAERELREHIKHGVEADRKHVAARIAADRGKLTRLANRFNDIKESTERVHQAQSILLALESHIASARHTHATPKHPANLDALVDLKFLEAQKKFLEHVVNSHSKPKH